MRFSFVVMTYNQESFVHSAVAAALAQDHPGLEIVLSDDCSQDGTYAIMEEMARSYRGPHRVVLNRNPQNLGLIGHVNHLFSLTGGDYVIYSAGDDISEPHRARAISDLVDLARPSLVHSNVTDMNPDGSIRGGQRDRTRHAELEAMSLAELGRAMSHGIGATCAWHRDLFDRFGPIQETRLYEDRVMLFRARLIGSVGYIDDRLVRYRRGMGLTSASQRDPLKDLDVDIATLRQRIEDCRLVAPDQRKVVRGMEKKLEKRLQERESHVTAQNASMASAENGPSDQG